MAFQVENANGEKFLIANIGSGGGGISELPQNLDLELLYSYDGTDGKTLTNFNCGDSNLILVGFSGASTDQNTQNYLLTSKENGGWFSSLAGNNRYFSTGTFNNGVFTQISQYAKADGQSSESSNTYMVVRYIYSVKSKVLSPELINIDDIVFTPVSTFNPDWTVVPKCTNGILTCKVNATVSEYESKALGGMGAYKIGDFNYSIGEAGENTANGIMVIYNWTKNQQEVFWVVIRNGEITLDYVTSPTDVYGVPTLVFCVPWDSSWAKKT